MSALSGPAKLQLVTGWTHTHERKGWGRPRGGTAGEAGGKVRLIDQQSFQKPESEWSLEREKTAERIKEGLRVRDEGRARGRVSPRAQNRGTRRGPLGAPAPPLITAVTCRSGIYSCVSSCAACSRCQIVFFYCTRPFPRMRFTRNKMRNELTDSYLLLRHRLPTLVFTPSVWLSTRGRFHFQTSSFSCS